MLGVFTKMLRYILKRIVLLIPVIICVSLLIFILMDLAPGSIIDSMISDGMTTEDIAALRAKYDLDRSVFYRYGKYMFKLVQGDLGISDASRASVWRIYITRLPNTLLLALGSLIVGCGISIPLGIRAARRAGKLSDTLTTTFAMVGMSMPAFWLGLLMLFLFSYWLRWLPAGGNEMGIRSFILPAVCAGMLLMATATRQTRSSMLEVLRADFLRTARAKGVPEEMVIRKHALGNAWIPIITTIGSAMGHSLAGAVVVETVFSWPGVGRAVVDAVSARDVPTTCGLAIMSTIMYILVQLLVDLLYVFVDPRIKATFAVSGRKRRRAAAASATAATSVPRVFAASLTEQQGSLPEPDSTTDLSDRASSAVIPDTIQYTETKVETDTVSVSAESHTDYIAEATTRIIRSDDEVEQIIRQYKKRSKFGEIFHRLRKNRSSFVGMIIMAIMLLVLLGSLFISYESVTEMDLLNRFRSPDWEFPFGGDSLGRNMFLRTIYGTRYSIFIGLSAVSLSAFIGVTLGSIAGYFGKIAEDIIMRISDTIASIPAMLLGMVIVAVLGQNLGILILAVGIGGTPSFMRITRASVLSVRNHEFVEAAHAVGIRDVRVLFTQVLPNGLSPIIVSFTTNLGLAIIIAASLSFLGFGVPVPRPEWGALVSAGRNYIRNAPWITAFPGMFIMTTVLAFNLLGDGLRDALDPKLKK